MWQTVMLDRGNYELKITNFLTVSVIKARKDLTVASTCQHQKQKKRQPFTDYRFLLL
jgi:hypothetical protein